MIMEEQICTWVALDDDNNVILEAEDPNDISDEAKEKELILMWVPADGMTWIF